ncbi:hypothetical protein [Nostoc sp.]
MKAFNRRSVRLRRTIACDSCVSPVFVMIPTGKCDRTIGTEAQAIRFG